MKWYNKANTVKYKEDVSFSVFKDDKESKLIEELLPWMVKLAMSFSKDYAAIGTLDFNDLIQIANHHLVIAVRNLNWQKIRNNSGDPSAVIWKYVKKSVLFEMRHEITYYKDGMRSHRMDGSRRVDSVGDNFLTQLFPDFFDEQFYYLIDAAETTAFRTEQIAKGLDELMRAVLTDKERQIVELSYGIDCNKVSIKALAKSFYMSEIGIKKSKQRSIDKLKNYKFNKQIIEKYCYI